MPVILRCAYCRDALSRRQACYCSDCLTATHIECFIEVGRCVIPGCDGAEPLAPARPAPRRPARSSAAGVALAGLALVATGWLAAPARQGGGQADAEPLIEAALEALRDGRARAQAFEAEVTAAEDRDTRAREDLSDCQDELREVKSRAERMEARLACLRAWAAADIKGAPSFPALDAPKREDSLIGPSGSRDESFCFEAILEAARRFQEPRRYHAALECYDRALGLRGLSPAQRARAFAERGLVRLKIGDGLRGALDQSCAISLDQRYAQSQRLYRAELGCFFRIDSFEEAMAEAFTRTALKTQLLVIRGTVYATLARQEPEPYLDRASADLEAVLAADPKHAAMRLLLADMRSIQGRHDEARQLHDRALADARGLLPYGFYLRAVATSRALASEGDPHRRAVLAAEATRDLNTALDRGHGWSYPKSEEVFAPLADDGPFKAFKDRLKD